MHTLMVVDEARKLIDDLPYAKKVTVMLGAICHDFGKPPTTKFFDGRWRSHAHDEAGVEPTISFLDTLGIYTIDGYDVREQVVQLGALSFNAGNVLQIANLATARFDDWRERSNRICFIAWQKPISLGRNPEWLPKEKWFKAEAQEWFIERSARIGRSKKKHRSRF